MCQSPLFSSGLEVANFVVASDVLRHSWFTVKELYGEINDGPSLCFSVRFKTDDRNPNYNIIAFVTWPPCARDHLQGGGGADLVSSSTLKNTFPLFEFLCTKTHPAISIHKNAIQLFDKFHGMLDSLKSQISDSKPLLVTGHGLGGSVAALFTLWLLEKMDFTKTKRPLCVTFGSPLIGDKGLQEAILQYSTWNSCFLHVVSQQDPLPRALISPNISPPTEYKPFGTFLFCSEWGRCASFEDSESILELLKATYSEVPGNQNPNQGLQFFDYAEVVRQLHRNEICKDSTTLVLQQDTQPLRAGISTQLVAIGLKQHQEQQWHRLLSNTERQERQAAIWKRQVFDPSKKLNDMKINMARLEWYKKLSKDKGTGYYDSYKNETNTSDLDVVKYKRILTCYWEELVAEVDKKPQKEGATFRTRWLFGGTNYRRMTEPLFIAEHYKNGKSDYIKTGRSEHYKLLEQWYNEDQEKAASDPLSKKANVKASLTDDSCFWARVEEARISCKLLSNGDSSVSTKNIHKANLIEFEADVLGMLENYAVTPEIFLRNSSFMQWWSEYEEIIRKNFMGTAYVSRLTNWMRNRGYRDYASGNLLIP
ncbi:hypothetical protein CJ030_MR2G022316 [Morella rubra]|uniref:Senescence-associated carboxylesterase 101 n=1 Tax=Morella rubra TaxID=262757 RepID=A0A6A1WD23_9ROSI|nr:hypothetical protein CJ030_MR2G022316 [Morella rubra]